MSLNDFEVLKKLGKYHQTITFYKKTEFKWISIKAANSLL